MLYHNITIIYVITYVECSRYLKVRFPDLICLSHQDAMRWSSSSNLHSECAMTSWHLKTSGNRMIKTSPPDRKNLPCVQLLRWLDSKRKFFTAGRRSHFYTTCNESNDSMISEILCAKHSNQDFFTHFKMFSLILR